MAPGSSNEIVLKFRNEGTGIARNLYVDINTAMEHLTNVFSIVGSGTRFSIGSLSPGDEAEIRFTLLVDAQAHTDRSVSTSSSINLTDKDIKVIKQVPGVMYVNGLVSGKADLKYDNEKTVVSVTGVDTSVWRLMDNTGIDDGRYLQAGHIYSH